MGFHCGISIVGFDCGICIVGFHCGISAAGFLLIICLLQDLGDYCCGMWHFIFGISNGIVGITAVGFLPWYEEVSDQIEVQIKSNISGLKVTLSS